MQQLSHLESEQHTFSDHSNLNRPSSKKKFFRANYSYLFLAHQKDYIRATLSQWNLSKAQAVWLSVSLPDLPLQPSLGDHSHQVIQEVEEGAGPILE